MKYLKSILLVISMFTLSFSFNTVKADDDFVYTNTRRMEVVYRYSIDAYDVTINVKENNVLEITEKITANFKEARHGIIRKIPLRNEVIRNDGSRELNSVRLTNLDVSEEYQISNDSGYRVIKIGDASKTLRGLHEYVIKYDYNLGKDNNKNFDELYFNIIGTEWDTEINNITFTINMPSSFDKEKLGFSTGYYGAIGHDNVLFNVNGTTITGKVTGKLDREEGLNVRLELPDGYFVNAGIDLPILFPLMFIVPILAALMAYLLWNKFGKDDLVIETVEFYPPSGFNSAEIAYFYKAGLTTNDVNSLLVYLASKGYIKIKENNKNDFNIIKLKEYDGNNVNEQIFMNGLFKSKDLVTRQDLYDKFYKTIEKIRLNIDNYKNKALIYDSKAASMRVFAVILAIVSVIVTVTIPTLDYGVFSDVFPAFMWGGMLTLFLALALFAPKIHNVIRAILIIPILIFAFSTCGDMPIYYAASANVLTFIAIILGFVLAQIVCFFVRYMSKRTPYGTEMYGKIKGFKNFLDTAEKDRLEALVNGDPEYFYSILPFTYVLGISDKWIKKFESITLQEPDWYETNKPFTVSHLDHFLISTMSTSCARKVEASSSSGGGFSSGGGGFSGGGFSGGGSGGGGGSSW